MDHALRTISYIADIGDLVVLMARRRVLPTDEQTDNPSHRIPKMICHVFESDEVRQRLAFCRLEFAARPVYRTHGCRSDVLIYCSA